MSKGYRYSDVNYSRITSASHEELLEGVPHAAKIGWILSRVEFVIAVLNK